MSLFAEESKYKPIGYRDLLSYEIIKRMLNKHFLKTKGYVILFEKIYINYGWIMATYMSLGVNRIVNASANNSRAGSSCLSTEVTTAMAEASYWYVDMDELHAKCGKYIAEITGAEAGLITSGASGGLLLAAAACITRGNIGKMTDLPNQLPSE